MFSKYIKFYLQKENIYLFKFTFLSYCTILGKQLSRKARKDTSNIAKVRIHVERAIERLKNFRILEGNIPLSMVHISDQMVEVCAALCNLLPPLAK